MRLFGILCWALTFYFAPMVFGLPIVVADISLGPYLPSEKHKEEGARGCWQRRRASEVSYLAESGGGLTAASGMLD